jgi:ubiquinone/menaquinone biosynthesis C-methylase UbiE
MSLGRRDIHVPANDMTLHRKFLVALFAMALVSVPNLRAQTVAAPSHPTSTPYVADIGAGGGWFSVRAARRVAPNGRVIAEEINPKAIASIQQRAKREHLGNIETLLGTPDDPKLAPDSLDAALMLKVYHEIAHPPLVLASLRAALKPGARFGIIDRHGNGADHGLNEPIVRAEVEAAGFRQVGRYDFTKADGQDYFLIFEKR